MPLARTYAARVTLNRCVWCFAPLTVTDGAARRCLPCEERHATSNARYRAQPAVRSKRAEGMRVLREQRGRAGLCWECASPVAPGRKRCEHHLEMHRLNRKLDTVQEAA